MKLKTLSILICILINSISLLALKEKSQKTATRDDNVSKTPSDFIYKRVKGYIYSIAEDSMKSYDLFVKKKLSGSLPEGYPDQTRRLALKSRDDIVKWRQTLGLPTELFRMCIYPNTKISYTKWCTNNFFGSKNKQNSCLYNFCQVCCDHLVFVYKNAANKNIIGELLQFQQEQGITAIMDNIDQSVIQQCKSECKRTYPVDMPSPLQKPPRDNTLGSQKNPASSCMDIKKWGNKITKSGIYWIYVASKGSQKVFCDMETDKGGWTLFFNYVHQPGAEILLDENKLPHDLKTNSHMYLQSAGFNHRDVKEVRFLCTERVKDSKKYWHFKTMNRNIIETALTGDQCHINGNSLANSYVELKPLEGFVVSYVPSVRKSQLGKFNYFGRNHKGGFTVTSFGSDDYRSYWTVKGDDQFQDIFECGSIHRGQGATAEDDPNMVFTHHSIWFRGFPPSDDEARERFMNNLTNQAN